MDRRVHARTRAGRCVGGQSRGCGVVVVGPTQFWYPRRRRLASQRKISVLLRLRPRALGHFGRAGTGRGRQQTDPLHARPHVRDRNIGRLARAWITRHRQQNARVERRIRAGVPHDPVEGFAGRHDPGRLGASRLPVAARTTRVFGAVFAAARDVFAGPTSTGDRTDFVAVKVVARDPGSGRVRSRTNAIIRGWRRNRSRLPDHAYPPG